MVKLTYYIYNAVFATLHLNKISTQKHFYGKGRINSKNKTV